MSEGLNILCSSIFAAVVFFAGAAFFSVVAFSCAVNPATAQARARDNARNSLFFMTHFLLNGRKCEFRACSRGGASCLPTVPPEDPGSPMPVRRRGDRR